MVAPVRVLKLDQVQQYRVLGGAAVCVINDDSTYILRELFDVIIQSVVKLRRISFTVVEIVVYEKSIDQEVSVASVTKLVGYCSCHKRDVVETILDEKVTWFCGQKVAVDTWSKLGFYWVKEWVLKGNLELCRYCSTCSYVLSFLYKLLWRDLSKTLQQVFSVCLTALKETTNFCQIPLEGKCLSTVVAVAGGRRAALVTSCSYHQHYCYDVAPER